MSVHEYRSGRWVVRYRHRGRLCSCTANAKNLTLYGLEPPTSGRITKRQAKALEAAILHALMRGETPTTARGAKRETVRQAVTRYLRELDVTAAHHKNKTRWLIGPEGTSSRTQCSDSLVSVAGGLRVDDVGVDDLRPYRSALTRAGYADNTVLNALRAVRSFFNWCIDEGLCKRNPARSFALPSAYPLMPDTLSSREVDQLLQAAHGLAIAAPFRLILGLGLRLQEAQALLWKDVIRHHGDGVVIVRQMLKTSSAYREIPAPPGLLDDLPPPRGTHVLTQRNGEPWTKSGFRSALVRFNSPRLCRVPFHVTYKLLRATYGSFLINRGVPIEVVSKLMGHSSPDVTRKWYLGVRPSDHAPAVAKAFGGLLRAAG